MKFNKRNLNRVYLNLEKKVSKINENKFYEL